MEKIQEKKSIYSFTLSELRDYLSAKNLSKFTADQVYQWLYRHHVQDMELWTNVSKKIKEDFTLNLDMRLPKIIWNGLSKD